MTNVNAALEDVSPIGGTNTKGYKLGYLNSANKAAQNDTVTITNAKAVAGGVEFATLTIDADGTEEAVTIATNVITCTDVTTGDVSGLVYYLPK